MEAKFSKEKVNDLVQGTWALAVRSIPTALDLNWRPWMLLTVATIKASMSREMFPRVRI